MQCYFVAGYPFPFARSMFGKERYMSKKSGKISNGISNKISSKVIAGELPYEKFLRLGPEALTEPELLAIIIRTGTADSSPMDIGNSILGLPSVREEGLNGLHHVTVKELMGIKGIGEVKAVKLKCLTEFAMRMAMARAGKKLRFLDSASVAGYYMESFRHEKREKVFLLLLDNRSALLEECLLSIGTVNTSLVSPREVFLSALKAEAVHIILLHNHPSGDPAPSKQDILITDKIKTLGDMMDITLIDHIIIGDNKYMSFKEVGLL